MSEDADLGITDDDIRVVEPRWNGTGLDPLPEYEDKSPNTLGKDDAKQNKEFYENQF